MENKSRATDTEKTISNTKADRIARKLAYQGYTSLRVFDDGSWISPATSAQLDLDREYWNYTWTVRGYRPDSN